MRAIIIFTDDNTHWLSGLLHPSFRHVWCILEDTRAGMWISHDLTKDGHEVRAQAASDYDIAAHYSGPGVTIYQIDCWPDRRPMTPIVLNTCVSYTKQLVGLRTLAFTPYQLKRHLDKLVRRATECEPGLMALT
jgi:hypothetical protein